MDEKFREQIKDNYDCIMQLIEKSLDKNKIQIMNDFDEGLFITTGLPGNVIERLITIKTINPKLKIYIVTQSKNVSYYSDKISDAQIIAWDKPYSTELIKEIEKYIKLDKMVIAYFSNVSINLRNTNIVKLMFEIGSEKTVRCVIDELADVYIYRDVKEYISLLNLYDSFEKLLDSYRDEV